MIPGRAMVADRGVAPGLHRDRHWRTAIWALRTGYAGLGVVLIGVLLVVSGSTPWVLAVGAVIWLAAAAVTLTAVYRAWRDQPAPRPGFWAVRFALLRDSVRPEPPVEDS
jgi:hypothetical protein